MPSSTSTTTVALTITCPTDTAWSTPIQMYISWAWLASGWNVWESCVSSKNITVTSWDWSKTITMKWRDSASVPNETSVVSKSVSFITIVCSSTTLNVYWFNMPAPASPVGNVWVETATNFITNWTRKTRGLVQCQSSWNWFIHSAWFMNDIVTCNSWYVVDWPTCVLAPPSKTYLRSVRNTIWWPWWYALTSNTSTQVLNNFCITKWHTSYASILTASYGLLEYQESWWYACYCTTAIDTNNCNYTCPSPWTATQTYIRSITCN